ncbi:hypothetical protein VTO58DRAFT_108468 [Aureobasidium pullulans]
MTEGNKKLAVIGDAVMAIVVAEHWFRNPTSAARRRSKASAKLASHCAENETANHTNIYAGKTAATLLGAIMGALYLDPDCELNSVRKVMVTLGFAEVVVGRKTRKEVKKSVA